MFILVAENCKKIQCVDTSPLTSGESPMIGEPIVYAPIKFTQFVKNFDLGIAELDLTPVVIEGKILKEL